ncbi:bifunctional diguanylate cyclase/phosphodiesterase [Rheinheimera baltica]|uniref:bifunctional diguanylate cyclase/phosphodiesterase n=1 Tax=Rheinheimera baltica TaxID=67576 RepID=UPI00273E6487|nr:LapD/MoxY N-terminal periplasmic domain-containing protein [Rheinheimera baltica]MDP5190013.1 EAL domain-containing protein [Rheinheimera baltica]
MSLIKQLWIAIIVIVLLAFGSSFFISAYQTKNYLAEQLQVKNIDNATGMALTLSQMDKDLTTMELMLSAQFDTGYYRRIALKDIGGNVLVEFALTPQKVDAPNWFVALLNFDIKPGIAQIQDSWQRFGTIELESQSDYSVVALWQITMDLATGFVILAMFCGLVGSILLNRVRKPLNQVVTHAEALGNRQFITTDEPATFELKRLVAAMNRLTGRVRYMLEQEQKQLDRLQRQYELDNVTGAFNREYCASWLEGYFNNKERSEPCCVFMLRVIDLQAINLRLGRSDTDVWLKRVVDAVRQHQGVRLVSRLNGSDFFVVFDQLESTAELCQQLVTLLNTACLLEPADPTAPILVVGISLDAVSSRQQTLSQLDAMLVDVESKPLLQSKILYQAQGYDALGDATDWLKALKQAIHSNDIMSQLYPVQLRNGTIMHHEAMLRMQINAEWVSAGQILGWARRYQFISHLDIAMVKRAVSQLKDDSELKLAVNISDLTFTNAPAHYEILKLLQSVPQAVCKRLSMEFDEALVVKHQILFISFVSALKALSVEVGLQKCGFAINEIKDIEQLGIDYLKIDAAIVLRYKSTDTAQLLAGLIKLAHTLSLKVIAEGVTSSTDIDELLALGFDGLTGPGIS